MIIISPEHETYPVTYTAYCKSMDNRNTRLRGPLLWLLCATSFGFVVVQLDVTIVNVALPQIGSHLHAGVAGLQWVVDGYTLSFAALLISAGVIGDRFGSRRVYLAGFAIFTLASIICGAAPSIGVLIAARALQGAGAALLVPTSLAILTHSSTENPALRARMVGLWTAAGGVSIAAGPVAGGLLLGLIRVAQHFPGQHLSLLCRHPAGTSLYTQRFTNRRISTS